MCVCEPLRFLFGAAASRVGVYERSYLLPAKPFRPRYVCLLVDSHDSVGNPIKVGGPNLLQIVETPPVYMFGAPHLPDQFFASVFAAVWRAIPRGVRGKIRRHWQAGPEWGHTPAPRIALVAAMPGGANHAACCSWLGHELRFSAWLVTTVPASAIAYAVAHELAHVLQHATDRFRDRDESELEQEADELADGWVEAVDLSNCIRPPAHTLTAKSPREWRRRYPELASFDSAYCNLFFDEVVSEMMAKDRLNGPSQ